MPHLRLEVAEEMLRDDYRLATGFDARKLLDHLVQVVAGLRMENVAVEKRRQALLAQGIADEEMARTDADGKPIPAEVPFINLSNLKHAIIPLHYAHVAGDSSKRFLHCTLRAGNDTPGRTAAVRSRVSQVLGDAIDQFAGNLEGLASVTVHVQDIDRDRGYSTTAERKKKREQGK